MAQLGEYIHHSIDNYYSMGTQAPHGRYHRGKDIGLDSASVALANAKKQYSNYFDTKWLFGRSISQEQADELANYYQSLWFKSDFSNVSIINDSTGEVSGFYEFLAEAVNEHIKDAEYGRAITADDAYVITHMNTNAFLSKKNWIDDDDISKWSVHISTLEKMLDGLIEITERQAANLVYAKSGADLRKIFYNIRNGDDLSGVINQYRGILQSIIQDINSGKYSNNISAANNFMFTNRGRTNIDKGVGQQVRDFVIEIKQLLSFFQKTYDSRIIGYTNEVYAALAAQMSQKESQISKATLQTLISEHLQGDKKDVVYSTNGTSAQKFNPKSWVYGGGNISNSLGFRAHTIITPELNNSQRRNNLPANYTVASDNGRLSIESHKNTSTIDITQTMNGKNFEAFHKKFGALNVSLKSPSIIRPTSSITLLNNTTLAHILEFYAGADFANHYLNLMYARNVSAQFPNSDDNALHYGDFDSMRAEYNNMLRYTIAMRGLAGYNGDVDVMTIVEREKQKVYIITPESLAAVLNRNIDNLSSYIHLGGSRALAASSKNTEHYNLWNNGYDFEGRRYSFNGKRSWQGAYNRIATLLGQINSIKLTASMSYKAVQAAAQATAG